MCSNCWARLRQNQVLDEETATIRREIVAAVLMRSKIKNDAERDSRIVLDTVSQACLLILDLYRTDREPPADAIVEPTADGCGHAIGVNGKAPRASINMHSP
jgi:hypothetical protein